MVYNKLNLELRLGKKVIKGKICNIVLYDILIDTGAAVPVLTDRGLFDIIKTKKLVKRDFELGGFGGDGTKADIWEFETIEIGDVIFPHVKVVCAFNRNHPSLILPWGAYSDGVCNFNFAEETVTLEKPEHIGQIKHYISKDEYENLFQNEEIPYLNLIVLGKINNREIFIKKNILDKVMKYLPNSLDANTNDIQDVINMWF